MRVVKRNNAIKQLSIKRSIFITRLLESGGSAVLVDGSECFPERAVVLVSVGGNSICEEPEVGNCFPSCDFAEDFFFDEMGFMGEIIVFLDEFNEIHCKTPRGNHPPF